MKIRNDKSALNPDLAFVTLATVAPAAPSTPLAGIMSGAGDDTYNVPGDVVIENPNEGTDLVISTITYTLGANVENLTLSGSGHIDGTGNGLDNTVTGNDGNNVLSGNEGNDYLVGGLGHDTLNGGFGNDTLSDERGVNQLNGEYGDDYIFYNNIDSSGGTYNGGDGTDTLDTWTIALAKTINLADGTYVDEYGGTDTLISIENLIGSDQNDEFSGSDAANRLEGRGGADSLYGGNGDDTLYGGDDYDVIYGGDGVNALYGEGGDDYIQTQTSYYGSFYDGGDGSDMLDYSWMFGDYSVVINLAAGYYVDNSTFGETLLNFERVLGTQGSETLIGTAGANQLYGNAGNDGISGGAGADTLNGGEGNDTITVAIADDGADSVDGSAGNDVIISSGQGIFLGGNGNDTIIAENGSNETLDGGASTDLLDTTRWNGDYIIDMITGGTNYGESFVNFEYAVTGGGNDTVTGTNGVNKIDGGSGNDSLAGLSGNDSLTGGVGNDRLEGGNGSDTMVGGSGDDTYYVDNTGDKVTEIAGEGEDIIFSSTSYTLTGRVVETLTLTGNLQTVATGSSNPNKLNGNDNNNILDGQGGNDQLNGYGGADTMIGGLGNDTMSVDNVGDVVTEAAGEGTDLILASLTWSLAGKQVENLTLTGTANINATGSSTANILTGNAGNNVLDGGQSYDTMIGGAGDDTYYVQNVADKVTELAGEGNDLILTSVTYSLAGRVVETLTLTGVGHINGTGNANPNTLNGNSGDNILNGKGGTDVLSGGFGADIFLFETGSGKDTITDFSAAQNDAININAYTGGVANNGLVAQVGGNVVITLNGTTTITVLGAAQADVLAHMVW